jgi:hypothetical protein
MLEEIIIFDSNLKEIILPIKSKVISIKSDSIIKFNTQYDLDPFKEYKLLNYIQHDRTGRVIRSSYFTNSKMVNFIMIGGSYEYTFSYEDVRDFYSDEPVYNDEYHSYLKSIKRDIKLSKLLQ